LEVGQRRGYFTSTSGASTDETFRGCRHRRNHHAAKGIFGLGSLGFGLKLRDREVAFGKE
jgi:hypothetical protein